MEQKERESDNIELRSEKVRNVIGKVPPSLVSLGTVIITIIVLALAVAFYKIPYPISIEANGEVVSQRTIQVFVPYKYLSLFKESRTAHVSFEGNDNISYNCNIIGHNTKLIHREDGNYFVATAMLSTLRQNAPVLQKYMKADVRIIVSNKTLWQQVFG
jgi:hypothetical protein